MHILFEFKQIGHPCIKPHTRPLFILIIHDAQKILPIHVALSACCLHSSYDDYAKDDGDDDDDDEKKIPRRK